MFTRITKTLIASLLIFPSAQAKDNDPSLKLKTEDKNQFDTSSFKTQPIVTPEKSNLSGSKPAKSTFKPPTGDLTDEKTAMERVRAINTLLTKEKNTDRRRKLLFNKGILYLQYARVIRLRAKNSNAISIEEQNALLNTINDMNVIIKEPKISAQDQSYAYYIAGMAYSSSNQDDKSVEYMNKAIGIFPRAKYCVGVSLFLGEYYFDREQYKIAIDYYRRFYTRMVPKEKALAKYKTAWAYWNLRDIAKCQALFIELAKDRTAGEFGVDANKDLAYIMTQYKTESEILAFSDSIFSTNDNARLIFLTSAYLTLRHQKHSDGIQKIFLTILQLEKIPSKKVNLWLDEIRNNKFEFASASQYGIFEKLRTMFVAMPATEKDEVIKNIGSDLENEVQSLIRSFIDTYSGRIKNIEKLEKSKLALALEGLFIFHEKYFPKSKAKIAINQLWLEVCVDQKDLKCVYEESNKIISDPELLAIHDRANVELLSAVDELFRQDENKYRADYVAILEKYVLNPKGARWIEASKRLSAIYLNTKQFEKALPLLAGINDREKSEESYYRFLRRD